MNKSVDLEHIILKSITAQLDDLTASLDWVPGREPQDRVIACDLLTYAVTGMRGHRSHLLMNTLIQHGARPEEASAIGKSIEALALRLGAYLGRER